jgi:4-amino-4-deoxy-L-arabinose transferase-like glycosyltransferase
MPVIIKDIRFWIIAFFLIRLIGITNPPLEVSHNWRQTTVAMAARNFAEADNNILYPRIDIAGEKSGITGMEFPLLNYLIYLMSVVFGYDHWYGRLINLIVSSFGLWYFFRLVKDHFSEQVAFNSTIVLAVSVWFQFSRKIMPDTFAVSMVIAAVFYASCYFRVNENRRKQLYSLILFAVMMMMGVLSKLPAGFLCVLLLIPLLHNEFSVKKRFVFAIALGVSLVPSMFWYFCWVPHLVKTYGFWHFFMGVSLPQGITELMNHPAETLKMFYDVPLKFAGFAIFLFGVYNMVKDKNKWLTAVFVLSSAAFLLLMIKSGRNFYHHNYYTIPFVPVMALIAGYGLSKIKNQIWAFLILLVISVEGLANQQHDFKIKEQSLYLLNLEQELDQFSKRNDLFLINSGEYPTTMYFAHRKGWLADHETISRKGYTDSLSTLGLNYILIIKSGFGTEMRLKDHSKLYETDYYTLYKSR